MASRRGRESMRSGRRAERTPVAGLKVTRLQRRLYSWPSTGTSCLQANPPGTGPDDDRGQRRQNRGEGAFIQMRSFGKVCLCLIPSRPLEEVRPTSLGGERPASLVCRPGLKASLNVQSDGAF